MSEPLSAAPKPLTPTLLSIVLGLQGAVVFFAALTAFGLKRLDMAPAFIGGAVLMLLFFVAAGRIRRARWALWLGWALQAVLLATGIVLLPMLVVGGLFVALWVWSWLRGRAIDRANGLATDHLAAGADAAIDPATIDPVDRTIPADPRGGTP